MKVSHTEKEDGSLDITLSFDSDEVLSLQHDLPGIEGIVSWYSTGPSSEKIYKCKQRMISQNKEKLIMDLANKGSSDLIKQCLSDDKMMVKEIRKMSSYLDRKSRELVERQELNRGN